MAEKPEALPLAPNGEVKAYDRLGNKITVPKEKVGELFAMGGRVARKAEVAEAEVQARYDAKSTAEKAIGYAETAALATPFAPVVAAGIGDEAAPEVAAFGAGTRHGLTAGLSEGITRQAIEKFGTHAQGEAYAERVQQTRDASPIAHGAGALFGMGLGTAAGAAAPAGAISAAGNVAEQAAARGLAGLASRGAIGRALATGGELAARGAVEGALFGGVEHVSEDMLGDRELVADKLFAATGMGALGGAAFGGALGFSGSLLKSGAQAGAAGLSRVLGKGESAATKLGAEVSDDLARAGAAVEPEGNALRAFVDKSKQASTQKDWAYENAWKALNSGGLSPTRIVGKAERYLPNGTKDVGEVMFRKGILKHDGDLVTALREGTPAAMAPKINAQLSAVGSEIRDMMETSGGKVSLKRVQAAIDDIASQYESKVGQGKIGASIRELGDDFIAKAGFDETGGARVFNVWDQNKALGDLAYKEAKALDPAMRVEAMRDLKRKISEAVLESIDEASGKMAGEQAAKLRGLNKDYTALSIASEAAEDSAFRMAKNNTFGLGEKLAVGGALASGNVLAAPVVAIGGKVLRERGNAAAAVALYRMAEMGTLTKAIQSIDDAVSKAARGALTGPQAASRAGARAVDAASGHPYRGESPPPVRERAKAAVERVVEIQANPEAYVERVAKATEPMMQTAPNLAGAYMQRATSAAAFLASKLPVQPEADPFDPRPMARLSQAQAIQFMRYVDYVDKPTRFFDEAARGQITFEGVEVAKALMPKAFAEMQVRVAEGLAEMLAKGQHVPLRQRERLGLLMDAPLVPSQRPEQVAFLQSNVVGSDKANQPPPPTGASKPTAVKSPSSALDRLEERGAGRR